MARSDKIAVVNASTVVSDETAALVVAALQIQVTRDFAPAWGIDAVLRFAGKSGRNADERLLVILDDSDQAGALGYHDLDGNGMPMGKIFAGTDLKYGDAWGVTASHELLEMLADPGINKEIHVGDLLYAYEVCDACEADSLGYQIGNVLVSDFVYPAWFETFRAEGSAQFDFRGHLTKPLQLAAGGYIGVFDLVKGTYTQLTAEHDNVRARAPIGSRRERRAIGPHRWIHSHGK